MSEVDDDDDGVGALSQSEIIGRQADTIARLERHVARADEYRQVTKVRLKEAAARLREYRLRVEGLLAETATANGEISRLQQALADATTKAAKAAAAAAATARDRGRGRGGRGSGRRAVTTQTTMTMTALEELSARATRPSMATTATQTAEVRDVGDKRAAGLRCRECRQLGEAAASRSPAMTASATTMAMSAPVSSMTALTMPSSLDAIGTLDGNDGKVSDASMLDAISAEIDAALASSDDEDVNDNINGPTTEEDNDNAPATNASTASGMAFVDDAVSRAIDLELGLSDSDDDNDSSSSSSSSSNRSSINNENTAMVVTDGRQDLKTKDIGVSASISAGASSAPIMDAVAAAIDAELATSSSEDECTEDTSTADNVPVVATPLNAPALADDISAAIDAELAMSDDDEEDEDESMIEGTASTDQADTSPQLKLSTITTSDTPEARPVLSVNTNVDNDGPTTLSMASDVASQEVGANPVIGGEGSHIEQAGIDPKPPGPGPVSTPAEVTASRSRALSLSSASDSDSDSDSSSSDEEGHLEAPSTENSLVSNGVHQPVADSMISAAGDDLRVHNESSYGKPASTNDEAAALPANTNDVSKPATPMTKKRSSDAEDDSRAEVSVPPFKKAKIDNAKASPCVEETVNADKASLSEAVDDPMTTSAAVTKAMAPAPVIPPRALVQFRAQIALRDKEKLDDGYILRTVSVLLRASHSFVGTSEQAVAKLTKTLTDEYRRRRIPTSVLLEGIIRVLRTPRTRQQGRLGVTGVATLLQLVLFRAVRMSSPEDESADGLEARASSPIVLDFVTTLRDLVVLSQWDNIAREGKVTAFTATDESAGLERRSVSHDKAFLAHVCGLHTMLCRAINRLDLSRTLLLDILRANPTIKGLYLIRTIVEVNPTVLHLESDAQSTGALREMILHVLQVIAARSAAKQEVILREGSLALLSEIYEAIGEPMLLVEVDSPDYRDAFVDRIWQEHVMAIIARTADFIDHRLWETSMALEFVVMIQPLEVVIRAFGPERWGHLITDLDGNVKYIRLARLVSGVVRGLLQQPMTATAPRDKLIATVQDLLDRFCWGLQVREEILQLVALEAFLSDWMATILLMSGSQVWFGLRDRLLASLLEWLTSDRLVQCSAPTLRKLRLVVLVCRSSQLEGRPSGDPPVNTENGSMVTVTV